jgi:hypothetical protein
MLKFIIRVVMMLVLIPSGLIYGAHTDESAEPEIIQSELSFQTCEGGLHVSVIGKIHNASPSLLDAIALNVQFFDSTGKLIDAANQDVYDIVVPANGEAPFKIRTPAAAEQNKYTSHLVQIVRFNREVTRAAPPSQNNQAQGKDIWRKYFDLWGPILMLMLILLVITYGKKSPQTRLVELVEKQISLIESQNAIIERIANAAEHKNRTQDSTS